MPVQLLSCHCQSRKFRHLISPRPFLPLLHLWASPVSLPLLTYHNQSLRSPSHAWLMTSPSITSSEDRTKSLLLSTSIPHAGGWLSVIPSSNLGLHFLDSEFRLSLRYWLGLPLANVSVSCPVCSRPSDHSLACGGNNDRILRHNAIRDIILTAAALSPRREVPSLIPGSLSRPANVYLPNWSSSCFGCHRHLPSPNANLQAASDRGSALLVAEARKRTLHQESCRAAGVTFRC